MFFKRYGNLVLGLFFMAAAIAYYFLADSLAPSKVMDIGPDFVPKIVAGLTFLFALLLTLTSIQKLRETPAAGEKDSSEYGRVLLTIAAFAVYVYSFDYLGFVVSTLVYMLIQMPIMAPREKINMPLFGVIAVITSFGVYYVFKYRLDVLLPAGILPL